MRNGTGKKSRAAGRKKPDISAFFPAHNEEANIGALCMKTASVLRKIASRYEVIVVDDGSVDRTARVVEKLAKRDPRIRVVRHVKNQGYGAAVKTGFGSSRLSWIFFTDGDGQFDVEEMEKFILYLEDHDLVAGYRMHRADPFMRKLNAFAWGTLVKTLFGLRGVRDIDCAFKFIRRDVFRKFRMETTGAMISTELLVKARKNGFRIMELGVHHYPRRAGVQTGAKLKVIARAFKELFYYFVKWTIKGYR